MNKLMKMNRLALAMTLAAPLAMIGCGGDDNKNDNNNTEAAYFNRIATFPVCLQIDNNCDTDEETVAEIVDASSDGNTLIYTDSPREVIGFVNITDPAAPSALGTLNIGGEPTSVAVAGAYALVGVNTSESFTNPSGSLKVVDIATQSVVRTIDLGGQPDSVAVSPDGHYAVVAIENERDEDLDDGQIDQSPQLPAGYVVILDISADAPADWSKTNVDVTGLADIAPSDPEPEYVDINDDNVAVVTLQENNHLVLIDLATAAVTAHFSAGTVNLDQIDATEEDIISQTESLMGIAREPDGVTWIDTGYFVTADEGDMNGGSRGFTVFNTAGDVVWTSGNSMEHLTARIGHYPEGRSENKGSEPENAETARFDGKDFLFVNSERASVIGVYQIGDAENPAYHQVLPAASAPEGVKAIPSRNLLIAASENDSRDDKLRGSLNIYQYGAQTTAYPTIESVDRADGTPIPFAALSGLAADLSDASVLWSIEDSAFDKSRIFRIDTSTTPASLDMEIRIRDSNGVFVAMDTFTGPANADPEVDNDFDAADLAALINDDDTVNVDPEGIAAATDGGFWIASEGNGTIDDAGRPLKFLNFVFKTDAAGVIEQVITLPDEVNDMQLRFGFEGIAEYDGKLYVAFQRAWGGEDNPRIGIYDTSSEEWSFVFYPLDDVESQNGGWVGLSDISSVGDGTFLVLERDNQGNLDAAIKRIYQVDLSSVTAGSTVEKTLKADLLADKVLTAPGGLVYEKIEGLTVTSDGTVWINNDNDGVDDNSGENQLINLGDIGTLGLNTL
tara:strand:+ start:3248 stop:5614 length:2367 start_codon:yes stop_codon:yes gene_type:complete